MDESTEQKPVAPASDAPRDVVPDLPQEPPPLPPEATGAAPGIAQSGDGAGDGAAPPPQDPPLDQPQDQPATSQPPQQDQPATQDQKSENGNAAPPTGAAPSETAPSSESSPPPSNAAQRKNSLWGAFFSILLLAALIWGYWFDGSSGEQVRDIEYAPDFIALVEAGCVPRVQIVRNDTLSQISGKVRHPTAAAASGRSALPMRAESGMAISPGDPPRSGADSADEPLSGEPLSDKATLSESPTLAALLAKYPDGTPFRVNARESDAMEALLVARGVAYEWKRQDTRLAFIIAQILPTLLFFGLVYFFFYRGMRGRDGLGFGKSRAIIANPDAKGRVTFKDVAGCDEAKEDVVEVVEYLKNPGKFGRLGGKMPRGILLSGPPGTGKTLLAKAIAGEAGVPFFSISGSDFVEMFVGVGASRVRDMFVQAKKHSPCLVFIDEIDAVGRRRGAGIGGGHDEREQTLNALLVEMDGFGSNSGIVVIAATNRPDVLDPALLRPGRFDRQLVVDLPTMEGRLAILKVHAAKVKLAPGTDLSKIARGTPGCSGADLANIVNEAALVAARAEKPGVDEDDFEAARDKVLWGKERRSHAMDDEEKRLTAYHEAGHAVCAVLEKHADPVHKVTIIPRGMALGLTAFLPKKDRTHYSRSQILADLVVAMGGRAAEETFLDDVSTGARQDIKQATQLAHSYVCDWGLSDALGPRAYGKNEELVFLGAEVNRTQDYSEETARKIDAEVDVLLRNAHEVALEHLRSRRDAVEALVKLLLEKETVDGDAVEALVNPKT